MNIRLFLVNILTRLFLRVSWWKDHSEFAIGLKLKWNNFIESITIKGLKKCVRCGKPTRLDLCLIHHEEELKRHSQYENNGLYQEEDWPTDETACYQ